MSLSLFKPPFQLLSRHRIIAYPFETLVPSYIALNDFTEIQLVGYFVYFPFEFTVSCTNFVERRSSKVSPLVAFVGRWRSRRKDDDFIMMPRCNEMKTSTGGINLFDEGTQDREDPLEFRNQNSPLLHRLNLGTRFLVVEENCDTRVITLQ
jgi:hypothetical protein